MSLSTRVFLVTKRVQSIASKTACVRLTHSLSDKEKAAEARYFNEKDQELLESLLKKMKAHVNDKAPAPSSDSSHVDKILEKYKVSPTDAAAVKAALKK